jgi:hypothetical protein
MNIPLGFQLPPYAGGESFPEAMQFPPVVNIRIDTTKGGKNLDAIARGILGQYESTIQAFVLGQRQISETGIVAQLGGVLDLPGVRAIYSMNNGMEVIDIEVTPEAPSGGQLDIPDELRIKSEATVFPVPKIGVYDLGSRDLSDTKVWSDPVVTAGTAVGKAPFVGPQYFEVVIKTLPDIGVPPVVTKQNAPDDPAFHYVDHIENPFLYNDKSAKTVKWPASLDTFDSPIVGIVPESYPKDFTPSKDEPYNPLIIGYGAEGEARSIACHPFSWVLGDYWIKQWDFGHWDYEGPAITILNMKHDDKKAFICPANAYNDGPPGGYVPPVLEHAFAFPQGQDGRNHYSCTPDQVFVVDFSGSDGCKSDGPPTGFIAPGIGPARKLGPTTAWFSACAENTPYYTTYKFPGDHYGGIGNNGFTEWQYDGKCHYTKSAWSKKPPPDMFGDVFYNPARKNGLADPGGFEPIGQKQQSGSGLCVIKGRPSNILPPVKAKDIPIGTKGPSGFGVADGVVTGVVLKEKWEVGDVVMVAVNTKTRKVWFGINGKWIGPDGDADPAKGQGEAAIMDGDEKVKYYPAIAFRRGAVECFANYDGQFKYPPPGGFAGYSGIAFTIAEE